MGHKKILSLFLSAVLLAITAVPAYAHGGCHGGGHHGRGRWDSTQQYQSAPAPAPAPEASAPAQPQGTPVCPYGDCATAGRHYHDGVLYCGYAHEGGYCDGNCIGLCTVEGCDIAGRHSHDGGYYCGSYHSGGFCNGHHGS